MRLIAAAALALGALTAPVGDAPSPEPARSVLEERDQRGLVVTVVIPRRDGHCDGCSPLPPTGADAFSLLLFGAAATASVALGAGLMLARGASRVRRS